VGLNLPAGPEQHAQQRSTNMTPGHAFNVANTVHAQCVRHRMPAHASSCLNTCRMTLTAHKVCCAWMLDAAAHHARCTMMPSVGNWQGP
jgi:hypothetical protein